MSYRAAVVGSLVGLLAANLSMTAAAAQDATAPLDEARVWRVTEQAMEGSLTAIPGEVIVTVAMDGGAVKGRTGCNPFSSTYTIDGETLVFGPIFFASNPCTGVELEAERAFKANLFQTASWQSDGTGLTFADADGSPLMALVEGPESDILGGWTVASVAAWDDEAPAAAGITADFRASLELVGFDGCNQYVAEYEVYGDAIDIGDVLSAVRAGTGELAASDFPCDDALRDAAMAYRGALADASSWSVDADGGLELRDESGAVLVAFDRPA